MKIQLREYQTEALCVLLEYARKLRGQSYSSDTPELPRRVLAIQPTGAGKTVLVLSLAYEAFRQFGWRSMFVVPSRELLHQTAERAAEFFPRLSVGKIGDGAFELDANLIVATGASLAGDKLRRIPPRHFGLIVCDEAHHAAARSYSEMLDYFARAEMTLGVTATYIRGDGESIASEKYFPNVVVWNTVSQLTRANYLVPAYGHFVFTRVSLEKLKLKNGDYDERELSSAVNTPTRNALAAESYLRKMAGRPTVCFCVDVRHALDVETEFRARGIKASAVWGAMPRPAYEAAMNDYNAGKIDVLINAKLLIEGWDAPATSGVLILRPATEASAAVLGPQMIGRALRPSPKTGKRDAVIVELRDDRAEAENGKGTRRTTLIGAISETDDEKIEFHKPLHEQAEEARAMLAWDEREKLLKILMSDEQIIEAFDVMSQLEAATAFLWVPLGDVLFMPLLNGEFLEIVSAAISCYEIRGLLGGKFEVLGTAQTQKQALAIADNFLSARLDVERFITRDKTWRTKPPSEKQLVRAIELTGLAVKFLAGLNAGQISDIIRSALALRLKPQEIIAARNRLSVASLGGTPYLWA